MTTQQQDGNTVTSRLSRLEAKVESIAADIGNLTLAMCHISTPNWSTYIGFAGIILSIVGMVGGAVFVGYSSNQHRLETSMVSVLDRALVLEFERGKATTKIDSLVEHTKQLDINLQREMRDVNSITEAKLAALDLRLQDEIKRAAATNAHLIQANAEVIQSMQEYQNHGRTLHGEQNERLRALERSAFKP